VEPPGVELANGADAHAAVAAKLEPGIGATLSDTGAGCAMPSRTARSRGVARPAHRRAPRRDTLRWVERSRPAIALTALARS
jgi:hypothetical protein